MYINFGDRELDSMVTRPVQPYFAFGKYSSNTKSGRANLWLSRISCDKIDLLVTFLLLK